jgi:FtsZ-binding cell division protein ZapB
MDFNGRVIMSLNTYDHLQMELAELQAEVERLKKELDGIRVFELKEKNYSDAVDLNYTDYALKQYTDLVSQNPHLKFKTESLEKRVEWDIAKRKAVEVDA